MKQHLSNLFKNDHGFLFPLVSFIILLLLLLTFHQIKQYEAQRNVSELNIEQYRLEMLHQKTYLAISEQETEPPYHFSFPDGIVDVTVPFDHPHLFQAKLETNKGSYREITIKMVD